MAALSENFSFRAVRGAAPLREEVVRPQRTIEGGEYLLPSTFNI
jgi:hypothetical protein